MKKQILTKPSSFISSENSFGNQSALSLLSNLFRSHSQNVKSARHSADLCTTSFSEFVLPSSGNHHEPEFSQSLSTKAANWIRNRPSIRVVTMLCLLPVLAMGISGCQNPITKAARNIGYSAYEVVGIQKRDLLKTRVDDARDEQKEAGEDFQDALQKLKALTGFKGGELEKQYDQLKSSYEKSKHQAEAVRKSVKKVEVTAADLFSEWEKEIGQMETASLKEKSRQTLSDTRKRYSEMHSSLKASESRMDPVLRKLNDQVLFIKHNLNAKALASLKGETLSIQNEIEALLKEMNTSIENADKFIKQMP